jgi:ABC-type transporter Mla MlaB component
MLRISETRNAEDAVTLRLEGRVAGLWVAELQQSCGRVLAQGRRLTLDLEEVTFIERAALALFRELQQQRVALVNGSAFIREQLRGVAR